MSPASMVSNRVVLALTSWHVVGVVTRNRVRSYVVQIHTRSNPTYPMDGGGVLLWSRCDSNWHQSTFFFFFCCQQFVCVCMRACICVCLWLVTAARLRLAGRRNDRHPFWAFLRAKHFHLRKPLQHHSHRLKHLFRNKPWNFTNVSLIACEMTS